MIESLITGSEAFEVARDAVASILAAESASQQARAIAASQDPAEWAFDVFAERAAPLESWITTPTATTPMVNVWFESADFPATNSSVSPTRERATIHIDCHALDVSRDVPAGGHIPADEGAARRVQRVAALVRQILDSGHYTYLGSVRRSQEQWCYGARVSRIQSFQPALDVQTVGRVQGCRVTLDVALNRKTSQVLGDVLELLDITATRSPDGKIIARIRVP